MAIIVVSKTMDGGSIPSESVSIIYSNGSIGRQKFLSLKREVYVGARR